MIKLDVTYMRYSDHKQDDGFSIEYQTTEITEFAERQGITIDRHFVDKAQTATKIAGREEFFALMNEVKAGKIKTILCYKLSRMFRNSLESAKYRELCREKSVRIMSVTQQVDEDTSAGRLTTNVLASIDQYQSETISDHVKSSMREMARQGFYTGGTVRFGFALEEIQHGTKKRKKYKEHPTESLIVKKVFEMAADGMSIGEIRNYLNQRGETTRQNKAFTASYIQRIIRDDIYIGIYRYKTKGYDEIVVDGAIPALVDKMVFLKANKLREERRLNPNPSPRRTDRIYALTGKIRCAVCGKHFIGYSTKKHFSGETREYNYYICKEKKVYKRCNSKFLQQGFVENAALQAIKNQILNDEKIKEIAERVVELNSESPDDYSTKLKDLESRRSKISRGIDNMLELFFDDGGIDDGGQAKKKIKEKQAELREIEKTIFMMKEHQKTIVSVESVSNYMYDLLNKATSDDREQIKAVLDAFVKDVIVTNESVKITLNAFVDDVAPSLEGMSIPCYDSIPRI